jgi:outer membrane protein
MKTKSALFLGLLMATNISHAELKIGYVNLFSVLEKAPQAEKAKKRLEQEFLPRNRQLESQFKDIQTKEEKMARDSSVMSESERVNLEKDLLNRKRDAKRSQQEFSEDFSARRNEELGKIQRRVSEVTQALAKEQGFDLVIYDGVIYASEKIDVTAQVQQKLAAMPE